MKVLQICAAYKPAFIYGGPTMSVSMLSEQLALAGVSIEVYATTANGKVELDVIPNTKCNVDGVTVTYFNRLTKDHSHYSPAMFRKLWHNVKNFDIVHIHAWWNLVSLFCAFIAIVRNVPVIISPRGTLSPYSFQNNNIGVKWFIHHLFGKWLMNKSYFHVTSEREKKAVIELLNPLQIFNIPNFVKLPTQQQTPEHTITEKLSLLFFSRVEQKKGLDILFEALALVTIPYKLTIAGDGDKAYIDNLRNLAYKLGIDSNIEWIGFQSQNKFELMNSFDLFILPSHDENFGNAVIESLAASLPVLISDNVGLADYVETHQLGWICKTNSNSISDIINTIGTGNNETLKSIRQIAPGIIYYDFKPENLVNKYTEMYSSIINKPKGS